MAKKPKKPVTLTSMIKKMQKDNAMDVMIILLLKMDKNNVGVKHEPSKSSKELLEAFDEFKTIQEQENTTLKYTEKELQHIESKIDEIFPEGHEPYYSTLIPFGFYLGQLLIKKVKGARWYVPPELNENGDIFDICVEHVRGDQTLRVQPFSRVKKFWMNRNDKMSVLVRMFEFQTEITLNHEYWSTRADEDGWITMPDGYMFRMFKAEKDDPNFNNAKGIFHDGTI